MMYSNKPCSAGAFSGTERLKAKQNEANEQLGIQQHTSDGD